MNKSQSLAAMGVATALYLACGDASTEPNHVVSRNFHWEGAVAAFDQLEIRGINGNIEAAVTPGDVAGVHATIVGPDYLASEVEIEVVRHAGGVTVCARYPDRNGDLVPCLPNTDRADNIEPQNVRVEFTITVPVDVIFSGWTVNGNVAVDHEGDVLASSVNGDIDIVTSSVAEALTVNGSIDVSIGAIDWGRALSFVTVNGNMRITISGDADATVEGSTVNGNITTDFPLNVTNMAGAHWLRGSIGAGTWHLFMTTVNGDLSLRKRN